MTEAVTFSAADQALCLAVLKQIEVGKLNYVLIQKELGLPTPGAARVRWSRFKSRLGDNTATNRAPKNPPSTPKSKAIPKSKKGSSNKKRKIQSSDEEDEMEDADTPNTSQDEIKDEEIDGGDVVMKAAETPSRKLPIRRARVTSFKDLVDGSDGEGGKEEADNEKEEFVDSGHEGTPERTEEAEEGHSDEEV